MLEAVYRCSSVEWKPSPVVALATSADESRVAAAREDGTLEIWLVSPGSVCWHCQLTIQGNSGSRVSSLVWCRPGFGDAPSDRLFSSSIDGSVSEWDLFDLRQKIVLDSIGASIWQMAAESSNHMEYKTMRDTGPFENGSTDRLVDNGRVGKGDSSESEEDDDDSVGLNEEPASQSTSLALACDDGFVRIYKVFSSDKLTYYRSLPRVSGRVLSVTWSPDTLWIYSGSSDGYIRCWDVKTAHEIYRITAGLGGLGSGPELCIWSLLALRCGTLVSADSTGSVQFWDSRHGTLQQAHSYHKGDANALASSPSHNRVYSAGSDGQVILYKLSADADVTNKWVYVGYTRTHTHDVRALTVAVPISREDVSPEEKIKKHRSKNKPVEFNYHKWARSGVPMLISGGDDTKLYAHSVKEFTLFSPHDICPAPQRVLIQLVEHTVFDQTSLLLVQSSHWLDILSVCLKKARFSNLSGGPATTDLVARVKSRASRKIICSAIASSGTLFAYSDNMKISLFGLKRSKDNKHSWSINKKRFSVDLPCVNCMVFSSDSSRLILAGHDRKIYVMDMGNTELVQTFTPRREDNEDGSPPTEPPITKIFTSNDAQWLAAINCFGDIYVFNLELQRQHWFISRLDGAAITAGGFNPENSNILILSTSLNQVYALDVEAKGLDEWSLNHTFSLPMRFQEFPGEVIGLSFPPNPNSSTVVIYSPGAMCLIDFGMPVVKDDVSNNMDMDTDTDIDTTTPKKKLLNGNLKKRKLKSQQEIGIIKSNNKNRRNFEICRFKDPVLFVGHLSKKSVLIIDKPWMEVVTSFDTPPVHKHIYGT